MIDVIRLHLAFEFKINKLNQLKFRKSLFYPIIKSKNMIKIEYIFQLFNINLLKFADLDQSYDILFYSITIFYLFYRVG